MKMNVSFLAYIASARKQLSREHFQSEKGRVPNTNDKLCYAANLPLPPPSPPQQHHQSLPRSTTTTDTQHQKTNNATPATPDKSANVARFKECPNCKAFIAER